MKAQSFIKGALIISVGGIVAKILGALYRIPLTNILGGEGMGIYQMVYPLYCLLLTLSATGIPSALCRIVSHAEAAGARSGGAVLRKALLLFSLIGAAGTALMFALAPVMSAVQREADAVFAYRMLAPSVLAVSVISCFRGYFQGKNNFLPTALSEILEQIVKISLGLFFAYTYRQNIAQAVAYCLLAVTVSEAAAALFMIVWYRISEPPCARPLYRVREEQIASRTLFRFVLPVAVAAGVLPLSNILDSIIIVNLIGRYAGNATALYGVFSGGANTLVNLPVSVCYGLAAAVIPLVSSLYAQGMEAEAEKKIVFALKCTLFISLPAAAFLFAFPAQISALLFRSVVGEEGAWLVRLIRIMSFGAVLLSAVQTLSACLTGRGKPKIAAFSMTAAVVVKLALEFFLIRSPKISVSGAAFASIGCYFVALLVNLLYSIRDKKNLARTAFDFVRLGAIAALAVAVAYPLRSMGALVPLAVAAAVYLPLCVLLRCFSREEIGSIGRRKNYADHRRAGMRPGRSYDRRKRGDFIRR